MSYKDPSINSGAPKIYVPLFSKEIAEYFFSDEKGNFLITLNLSFVLLNFSFIAKIVLFSSSEKYEKFDNILQNLINRW